MGSSETVKWAAAPERKYPFLVTFSSRELVARYLNVYRDQAKQYGYEASPDQLGWASPVYVADTDERARKEAREGIETLFNDFLAVPFQMLLPPGYMSLPSMKNTMRMRKALGAQKRLTMEELAESGTVVVGSPQTVRDQLAKLRDETRAGKLITMLQFGTLSDELTKRNMEMFASEVMPHLHELACGLLAGRLQHRKENAMRISLAALGLAARGERRIGAGPALLAAAPDRALSGGRRDRRRRAADRRAA